VRADTPRWPSAIWLQKLLPDPLQPRNGTNAVRSLCCGGLKRRDLMSFGETVYDFGKGGAENIQIADAILSRFQGKDIDSMLFPDSFQVCEILISDLAGRCEYPNI
jgi:hypothetical protein